MVLGSEVLRSMMPDGHIGPASIDMTLSNSFLIPKEEREAVMLGSEIRYKKVKLKNGQSFYLYPGQFVLAATNEYFYMDKDVCGFVQGRSSIGRIGLTVQNAGFVDPGFKGTITLELVNESPNTIKLVPGYRIAQMVFLAVLGNKVTYSGKYQGQIDATGSRMYLDAEVER